MGSASFRSGSAESTQAPSASVETTAAADRIRFKARGAIELYKIMRRPRFMLDPRARSTMSRQREPYHNRGGWVAATPATSRWGHHAGSQSHRDDITQAHASGLRCGFGITGDGVD